jgi:signal peptidase I
MNRIRTFLHNWRDTFVYCTVALLFTHTVAGPVFIPSGSMEPTMRQGDQLLVNRLAYALHVPFTASHELVRWATPARGDIVIFNAPAAASESEALFIKRVVGVAGDTVEVREHRIIVNGVSATYQAAEPGVLAETLDAKSHRVLTGPSELSNFGPFKVPSGQVFVMGDHRHNSMDSRVWGPLSLERVRGKAVMRLWHAGAEFEGPSTLQ